MKLKTIWTMPACTLQEKLHRTGEWALRGIAHRLPARLKYWVFIDVGAATIGPNETVPSVYYIDVLQRMEGGPR
jgi:hypothetical protein